MVREVVWSIRARDDRKKILQFWIKHNKSNTYSRSLNFLFKTAVKLIIEHPQIGKPTDLDNVRVKIIRDYLMIYEVTDSKIYIHSIWDSRQNPDKLKKILE
ncbi:MAG: type II toxin-antitoxin system RelE/ParE family toxin [Flammeovirgaceae bacterium]|nr:type II toxin-antitoxin system RelE/ParE family toxin [Flammeovirgaceae bacterium]